ncbi:hypothetical protein DN051_44120 (plasmid) [Streptomyces cadmiisoli]|uniref:CHAT domain-containing protein n=2 Tax=Streptomyces cadmiisoli TaxID=2184053 RepID=A0A2Z4JEI0_9ACTN|nr:hypothetical protein DN051_44120 [Streptomyces cadmiisoli]
MVARLVMTQNTRDPACLRDPEAVADALALLREAAPSPEHPVDLDSVAAVFWTFWSRHQGAEDPDAAQNQTVVFGTFGYLCPRVPEGAGFPEALREGFDSADPSHEARFACLMSSTYAGAAGDGQAAALEAALAWSDMAFECFHPEDHVGFLELAVQAHDLHITRFQFAADPDGLAAAARYGRAVCERLAAVDPGLFDPAEARAVAAATLRTVVDSARLLGTPRLARVERLASAHDGALTPEAAEGLRFLRMLEIHPVSWPGERDLVVGTAIAEAGIAEQDTGRIACAVRRLRTALETTPAGHPAHRQVTAALSRALAAFAREREDTDAFMESMDLTDSSGELAESYRDILDDQRELQRLSRSEDPDDLERLVPLLERFVERVRESAAREGRTVDIDLEVVGLAAGFTPDDTSDEHIARYRTALAALPADRPNRHAYVAVLAALTGMRAEALRSSVPARAALLDAECRELTEEVLAVAPPGFPASDLLRNELFHVALPAAVIAATGHDVPGEELPDELRMMMAQLSRLNDVRLDAPENLDSDIETIRELLATTDEDDVLLRPYLAGALGSALSARSAEQPDPAVLEEIVELLRYARARTPDLAGQFDQSLAQALTALSAGTFDAEGAREAAALLASAPDPGPLTPEDSAPYGGMVATETDRELLSARTEFHNALQNYLLGHEPAQLERARRIARRIREITRAVTPGEERAWYDLMGDAYVDLVETVGPGGGPRPDLTDEVVEQCRRTFQACPAGHPMRFLVTMTLAQALMQRAVALRATEPERVQALIAEAEGLSHVLEEVTQHGFPIDMAGTLRLFLAFIGRGSLPEVSGTEVPGTELPGPAAARADGGGLFGPLTALLDPIRSRLAGHAEFGGWDGPATPVSMRAHGEIGAAAGALARAKPRVDLALAHLEAAVEAMAALTDRGSDQASAEHGLSTFEGDIRTVVALILSRLELRESASRVVDRLHVLNQGLRALETGQAPPDLADLAALDRTVEGPDVDRAAELLERGRGLLLARRIEARVDIGDLRAAHPELADEFELLTDQLDARPETADAGGAEWARLAGLRASNELDDLVRRIRTRPGFEGFLQPLTAGESKALAAEGPIVVLNHGKHFCHALVVTPRSITARPLEVEPDEITNAARRLRDAVDAINAQGASRPSPLQLVVAGKEVRETLAWTWHRIVHPVLESIGAVEPVPRHGVWPRIWWVPTGPFNALPLHAAQCTAPDCAEGGCGAALDTVVSSYAPGLQTLAYARARARSRGTPDHGSVLLVAAPEADLPGVAAAADYAAELLGAPAPLTGPKATRAAVLAALHDASWAHFGCHAATDPTEPSGALLHLPSGEPVSVLDICRARPRSAQLAFLAACGTARTTERLTDEAIHVTSSFLLAGFPAAVGTLWEIDSTHADHMTRDFYRRTTAADSVGVAHALHDTVRQLRRRIPDRPHIWAAYVHAGT